MDLVIGYGNTLCSDDAVGRLTAEAVEGWQLPGVQTLSVHQLTPELAADLSTAHRVIFIDASVAGPIDDGRVSLLSLEPSACDPTHGSMTHHVDPRGLLALSTALYGAMPIAYLLTVPVTDFAIKIDGNGVEVLSAIARQGMERALMCLKAFLAQEPDSTTIRGMSSVGGVSL